MKQAVILLVIAYASLALFCQPPVIVSRNQADSLQKLPPSTGIGEQVDRLNMLAAYYAMVDFDSSIMYSAQAVRIGTVYGYPEGIAMARYNTGNAYYFKLDMKNALLSYLSALRIAEDNQLDKIAALIHIQMGNINFFVQRSEKAITSYRKAVAIYQQLNDEKAINDVNINMYMTMYFLGAYPLDSALSYAQKTLQYARKNRNLLGEGHALLVFGMMYSTEITDPIKDSLTFQYSDTALKIITSLKDESRISVINLNLGFYYLDRSRQSHDVSTHMKLSRSHYRKGYESAIKAGSNYLQVICLNGLADVDISESLFESAEKYLHLAEGKLNDFVGDSLYRPHEQVDVYFERVFEYYLMRREKSKFYNLRFQLAMARGDYRQAVSYQQLNYQSNEEFRAEQEGRQLELLMAEAEAEKTDQRMRSLAQENELNQLKLTRSRFVFLGTGGTLVIISLFILLFFQRKRWHAERKSVALEQKLLRSQMNPHFIFNSLASIQNFVVNQKANEASIYLARFSQLVRNILDSSVDESVPLQREIETIKNYLELQKVRYSGQFDYSLMVDDAIDEETTLIPPMLAQPFIENAIEHGIRYRETPGHLDIRFRLKDDLMIVEVEDDGVGRKKAHEIELKQKRLHRSMSTAITRERLNRLHRKMKKKAIFEIIDLQDVLGEGCGTKVTFGIPLVT